MPRVVHFEIAAQDPESAVSFYSKVFEWEINNWEGPMEYWLIKTGEEGEMGIDGAIMKRSDPNQSIINTVGVDSLEKYLDRVTGNGGKVVTPVMPIPGVGRFAYCQDTEGIFFGILEPDESAM